MDDFPLYVESYYAEDATTMDLTASINYTYSRAKVWISNSLRLNLKNAEYEDHPTVSGVKVLKERVSTLDRATLGPDLSSLAYLDHIEATAAYNRSLDHTVVYVEEGSSSESYTVSSGRDRCFFRSPAPFPRLRLSF